ncbi:MAG TPA: hypothetical protein VLJ14_06985 [Ktedonobacterales bacterium]|jgi:hypothetical protein|nr:hypothetical protein [Ktedonobacterales bacterium]
MAEMKAEFPLNWRIGQDFDPNDHLMQLKGRDYLNVQSRLLWFIRDQRALIVAGLATMPYIVRSELVEQDREAGWAHFKTYVRDVLGNETTMYGSESAKDFGDYAEKASTKSLGRALLALGYGTAFAPEMDEGERVVDSPVDRRRTAGRERQVSAIREPAAAMVERGEPARVAPAARPVAAAAGSAESGGEGAPATEQQLASIRKLCAALGKPEPEPESGISYTRARELLTQLSGEYQRSRRAS